MFDVINRIVDNTMYRFKNQVLYKEDTTTQKELDRMKEYLKTHPNKDLENKVKLFEYGLAGEKQVLYELLHSGIGMYILHNVSFEYKGKAAQIDFVVITARCTYFIECKNFIGNITINSKGDFVRTYMKNNRKVTEGTYNPITQSKRHLEIIKEENYDNANILYKMNFEKTFDSFHDYIVVMANPKTIINDKYAPKNIKERLVKADQIIECLKRLESKRDPFRFEKDIKKVADVYIESNKEKSLLKSFIAEDEKENIKGDNKETIRSELKKYRLQKAKSLNYKPYFIFNDQTLEEILSIMPRTLTDLKKISGLGDKKIEFYGQDIINIINERSEEII
ncbi:MAG: HRDC domain-containing protein [Bacilli bacterium]|nr:HRDC domain-containing protein [bacterium]MDY2697812.1 HRDC domain-containing protein [Bacilli bacterium]